MSMVKVANGLDPAVPGIGVPNVSWLRREPGIGLACQGTLHFYPLYPSMARDNLEAHPANVKLCYILNIISSVEKGLAATLNDIQVFHPWRSTTSKNSHLSGTLVRGG